MNNKEIIEKLLVALFEHQLIIKMYHFQTKSYGAHKTVDKYSDKYRENLDKLMEVAQGAFGRVGNKKINIEFSTKTDENIVEHIKNFVNLLKELFNERFENYPELQNVKDDILADAQQLIYLLSFK